MIMGEAEHLTLEDVTDRWGCALRDIVKLASSGKIDAYTYLSTYGQAIFNYTLDFLETEEVKVVGIYKIPPEAIIPSIFGDKIEINDYIAFPPPDESGEEQEAINGNLEVTPYSGGWHTTNFDCEIEPTRLFFRFSDLAEFERKNHIKPKIPNATPSDETRDHLPLELKTAISVYEEFWENRPQNINPAREEIINAFIRKKMDNNVSRSAIDRIRTIARPQNEKTGGASKSDLPYFKGHSKENG